MRKRTTEQCIIALIPSTKLYGSERGNIQALLALKEAGAKIIVAISSREPHGGDTGIFIKSLGFNTIELPYGSHFKKSWMMRDPAYRHRQIKRLWTNSILLLRAIHRHRATHILIGKTNAFIFCALALSINRIPVIFRMGDAPTPESRFQMAVWHWMVRRSTHIVAISFFIKERACYYSKRASKKISVIHNIAPSRIGPTSELKVRSLRSHARPFQLVYVGQISPQKGVKELVQALIELNSSEIGCWIIGGSEYTRRYEEYIQRLVLDSNTLTKIEFEGYQNDTRPYFQAADLNVVPSQYEEPLGNIVQEAMIEGTPSIVTPKGGLPELILSPSDGMVLQGTSSNHLIEGILLFFQSMSKIKKITPKILHNPSIEGKKEDFASKWSRILREI